MLIGYFDYAVLLGLLYFNYIYWKRKLNWLLVSLVGVVVFGVLLPVLSIQAELYVNGPKPGDIVDGFNYWYVELRFPMYWGLFILQCLVLLLKPKQAQG